MTTRGGWHQPGRRSFFIDERAATLLLLMTVLAVAGIALFLTAPFIARAILGGDRDPVALIRMLQVVGAALLIAALFTRPYNRDTTAVPPPPDAPDSRNR